MTELTRHVESVVVSLVNLAHSLHVHWRCVPMPAAKDIDTWLNSRLQEPRGYTIYAMCPSTVSISACMDGCIHPQMHPPIHVSTYPCIHASTYPRIQVSGYPCIHVSIYPQVHRSMRPCVHRSIGPCIRTSIHPYIHTAFNPPYIHAEVQPCIRAIVHAVKSLPQTGPLTLGPALRPEALRP